MATASVTHMKPLWTSETRFGLNKNDQNRIHVIYANGQIPIIRCCLGFTDSGEIRFAGGSVSTFAQHLSLSLGRHSLKVGGTFCCAGNRRRPSKFRLSATTQSRTCWRAGRAREGTLTGDSTTSSRNSNSAFSFRTISR